jgi:hypothetical protein
MPYIERFHSRRDQRDPQSAHVEKFEVWFRMITAYFDDSGTHGQAADIVLVAGIFGTEARMEGLDRNWKHHLDSPLDGSKDPINRFHAYDCDNSIGDFTRWTRIETDYFRHQLRTVIVESDVAAYGMACSRKDWDELIAGYIRSVLGTPEGFCINQCFVRSVGWVQANAFDPHMTFVFDNRPAGVQRYAGTVYDAFEKQIMPPPQLAGYTFLSSTQVRPLQAADLIAWELNRYANAILIEGLRVPAKKEILHLKAGINFDAQIANREGIIKVRDHWINYFKDKPGWLEQFANHFDFFDPSNPNYSSLSDK